MLNTDGLIEELCLFDQELTGRLRRSAGGSVEWAEKLCDLLNEALDMHCRTLEGVEQHMANMGTPDVGGTLRDFLTLRQEGFSNLMRDSFGALQIQDVTRQSIERACDALEKRESILRSTVAESDGDLAKHLQLALLEYQQVDDLHRTPESDAA